MVDPQQPSTPSPDLLGDLLGPLAIEGPPGAGHPYESTAPSGLEAGLNADALAIAPVEGQSSAVQVCFLLLYILNFQKISVRPINSHNRNKIWK